MRDEDHDDSGPLTSEVNLEPVRFIARTDAVLRFGALMLGAGASSARVRDTMERAARALGIHRLHSRVGMTDIVVTVDRRPMFRTRVIEVRRPGVDAARITRLQRLSHEIEGGVTAAHLQSALDRIEQAPPLYPSIVRVIAAAAACAAFAFLNNGGWQECLSVGLAVLLGQSVRMLLARAALNEFLSVFIAASAALLGYEAVSFLLDALGAPPGDYAAAFTSAVLFLVPGFALVTGALDLARLDLNAGMMRVVYACLVLLATGCALWAVAALFQTSATTIATPALAEPLLSLARLVAGFVGVLGFAVLFSTPLAIALTAATIGAVANVGRLLLVDIGVTAPVAAAAAALAVGIGAFAVSGAVRAPRVTLTVPAVLIMIPGAAAYRAIIATIEGHTIVAVQHGVQAVLVVVALAIGLTVARTVTEFEWNRP